jgi:sarcosine oxidase, subunit alpha
VRVRAGKATDRTVLVKVSAPRQIANLIAGIRVQDPFVGEAMDETIERLEDDTIICRCERVTAGEIKAAIQSGVRDINAIKALTRAGMGSCGSKTCGNLVKRLFRELGVPIEEVTDNSNRPLFMEAPLGMFAGSDD